MVPLVVTFGNSRWCELRFDLDTNEARRTWRNLEGSYTISGAVDLLQDPGQVYGCNLSWIYVINRHILSASKKSVFILTGGHL